MIKRLRIATLCLVIGACTQTTVHPPPPAYTPPAPLAPIGLELTSNQGFDATWDALIDHASAASFAIDEFERDSGLLTLSFSPSDPQAVVDCGTWRVGNGPAVPYLSRDLPSTLRTRANILVRKVGGDSTRVRVNMLYDLSVAGNAFSFTTNQPATVAVRNRQAGSARTRTCQSNQSGRAGVSRRSAWCLVVDQA